MEPVDIIILSYFAHNANFSTPVDPPRLISMNGHIDNVQNWDILFGLALTFGRRIDI